jgi:hypothetical protein
LLKLFKFHLLKHLEKYEKSDLLASDKSLKILLRIRIRIHLSDPYKMSLIRNTGTRKKVVSICRPTILLGFDEINEFLFIYLFIYLGLGEEEEEEGLVEFSSVASPHHQERQSPHLLIEDDDDVILQVDDVMGGHVTEAAIVLPSSSSRRLADLLQVR